MTETSTTNQLPPRSTTNTRGSRKWATLGGRAASSSTTRIPTNDSDTQECQRQSSSSLFRKSSTISRTNGTPISPDENASSSLKKSRSLMNVLRSKLNSPGVLRRFRSKSRESTKQTVTEIHGHSTNDQQQQQPPTNNNEQISTRKSRKREPSPMRRFVNRISNFTRHPKSTSPEREKQSLSKSITNDSIEEKRKSTSPLHNKDQVDHINSCYDEIRAKYFNTTKPKSSTDDTLNRIAIQPTIDDPLLQARKQTNIKLNCLLSGYNLTRSFADHEKLTGQNDIFKFHHYYDVGKRRYDYNYTTNTNRLKPFSKSIDSFRRIDQQENGNVFVEKKSLETHQDLPKNELIIREDKNIIESKDANVVQTSSSTLKENSIQSKVEEHDEEFERNFLRAVDRALGVVNKEEKNLIQTNQENIPTKLEEKNLNLVRITEQALSSFQNSPLFLDDDLKNESVDHTDEQLKSETSPCEDISNTVTEQSTEATSLKADVKDLSKVDIEQSIDKDLSNVNIETSVKDEVPTLDTSKSIDEISSQVDITKSTDENSFKVETEQPLKVNIDKSTDDDLSKVKAEQTANENVITIDTEQPTVESTPQVIDKQPTVETVSQVNTEQSTVESAPQVITQQPTVESTSQVSTEQPTVETVSQVSTEQPAVESAPQVITEQPTVESTPQVIAEQPTIDSTPQVIAEQPIVESTPQVIAEQPTIDSTPQVITEQPTVESTPQVIAEQPTVETVPQVSTEQPIVEHVVQVDDEQPIAEHVVQVDAEQPTAENAPQISTEQPTVETVPQVSTEQTTVESEPQVITEQPAVETVPQVNTEQPITENVPQVSTEQPAIEELSHVNSEKPIDNNLSEVSTEQPAEATTPHIEIAKQADEESLNVNVDKSTDENSSNVQVEQTSDENVANIVVEKPAVDNVSQVDIEQSNTENLPEVNVEKPAEENLSEVHTEPSTNGDKSVDNKDSSEEVPTNESVSKSDTEQANSSTLDVEKKSIIADSINEDVSFILDELTQQVDDTSKVRSIND